MPLISIETQNTSPERNKTVKIIQTFMLNVSFICAVDMLNGCMNTPSIGLHSHILTC